MGYSKSSSKREVYSDTSLPQKTREISNNQSTLYLKRQKKKTIQNPKLVERKKEERAEVNETDTKKTTEKVNETKSCFFEKIKL